eukprot:12901488-Prorocentrum_lima.AAC.1
MRRSTTCSLRMPTASNTLLLSGDMPQQRTRTRAHRSVRMQLELRSEAPGGRRAASARGVKRCGRRGGVPGKSKASSA